MKRINPITGKLFVRGDTREKDNLIFDSYRPLRVKKDGFCYENWMKPMTFKRTQDSRVNSRVEYKKDSMKLFKGGSLKKRINPQTKEYFKAGDIREDGFIFGTYYSSGRTKGGYVAERWHSPEKFLRTKVTSTFVKARERAKEKNVNFNITINFLLNIFPPNYECPILKEKMIWSNKKTHLTPSLDRIEPNKGYIKGNVRWIADIANVLKLDRNIEIIEKIYFDMKKLKSKNIK